MGKGKKSESKNSRSEQLIEEAVRAVEAEEEEGLHLQPSSELEDKPERESGKIAKIDLKQFVEKEAYLRLAADFENFRKRALKERQESERNGREKALRGFLEIFDNIERGLQQAADDQGPLAMGMRMVVSQAEAWLKQEGLERIPAVGETFDPAVHEAVSQIESTEHPSGTVVTEVKRGYRWPDRLLRPASVIVSKNPEGEN